MTYELDWSSGYADVVQTFRQPGLAPCGPGDSNVRVFDLVDRDRESDAFRERHRTCPLNGSPVSMLRAMLSSIFRAMSRDGE